MNFSDFRSHVRRFNSTSVLEIGSNECWLNWGADVSSPLDWTRRNAARNYAIRIILLASAGNSHRHRYIVNHEFNSLIQGYYRWDQHTLTDHSVFDEEASKLLSSIQEWERKHEVVARNWSLTLSEILSKRITPRLMAGLFVQRLLAFQNGGFGHPNARLERTVKMIKLLSDRSDQNPSEFFTSQVGLDINVYFRLFYACIGLFSGLSGVRGFADLSRIPEADSLQALGITADRLRLFTRLNSALFASQADDSFRRMTQQALVNVPEYYQPFFYNHFLEKPFIRLSDKDYWLPDPLSLAESCWNQVRSLACKSLSPSELGHILSKAFEDYLEKILLPCISPSSFQRIPEIRNPSSRQDKRCDFLVTTSKSHILIECKTCVMSPETGTYFQADKVADLWCRIHSAMEQIASTVKAHDLRDKPVIPLILTFYDSIDASVIFREAIRQTDYCALMGASIPPIVYSIHEFEHWIQDRSLDSWSELKLVQCDSSDSSCLTKPDNQGHGYRHLNSAAII